MSCDLLLDSNALAWCAPFNRTELSSRLPGHLIIVLSTAMAELQSQSWVLIGIDAEGLQTMLCFSLPKNCLMSCFLHKDLVPKGALPTCKARSVSAFLMPAFWTAFLCGFDVTRSTGLSHVATDQSA